MRFRQLVRAVLLVAVSGAGACAHEQHVTAAQAPTPAAPPATATTAAGPTASSSTPVGPHIAASQNLVEQCRLDFGNQSDAPKFDFDQSELLPEDRDVLQQIAECVTSGPLGGRSLHLVGRADPRGTEEYNLGLGTRRAHTVAEYLEQLGVHVTQIRETTRGALDATGKDETGWRADRRVDLDLVN